MYLFPLFFLSEFESARSIAISPNSAEADDIVDDSLDLIGVAILGDFRARGVEVVGRWRGVGGWEEGIIHSF